MYVALEQSNKLGDAKSRVWEIFPTYTVPIHGRVCEENTHRGLHGLIHGLEARPCMGATHGHSGVHGPSTRPCITPVPTVCETNSPSGVHGSNTRPCIPTVYDHCVRNPPFSQK